MGSVRQYRKKIKSAKGIAKITKALQMVSASKMKKAQDQAVSGLPYAQAMQDLSSMFSGQTDQETHPFLRPSQSSRELVVVIAPDKGLCGGLISNVGHKVTELLTVSPATYEFITIGKKAEYLVRKRRGNIVAGFEPGLGKPNYEIVPPIAAIITDKFISGEIGRVSIIYTHFKNTMVQHAASLTLLPVKLTDTVAESFSSIVFEPSLSDIADDFFTRFLEVELYQLLLESLASEHSARMIAMKNATDNAKSLISYLSLEYNKARQSAITSEIADISSSQLVV